MNALTRQLGRDNLDWMFNTRAPFYDGFDKLVWHGDGPYKLTIAIPGVESNDIDLTINERVLIIKAETDGYKYSYTFSLPKYGDADNISASYKNGILTLVVERSESTKPKKIKVN